MPPLRRLTGKDQDSTKRRRQIDFRQKRFVRATFLESAGWPSKR
jgi:hypothetical protein